MKLTFSKKDKVILFSIILILGLLLTALYFFFIVPKNTELENKERELATQEELLNVIQNQINNIKNNTFKSTTELQKKVPVKPLVEQLILDIEKAEILSDSSVVSINFGTSSVEDNFAQGEETIQEFTEGEQVSEEAPIEFPAGLQKISVKLNVTSPSYFELEKFIETLENNRRIVVIDSFEFSGQAEITNLEQLTSPLSYGLSFAAFYLPNLTDLQDELPELDTPEPGNKKNPLVQFPDSDVVEENP
jgi:type IV pilus assembly protein PilO